MKPNLQQIFDYWQGALRLRDWQIFAEYVPNLSYQGQAVYGLCMPCSDNRTAHIQIRDPETPVKGETQDPAVQVEKAAIHELSHLWFAPLGTRSPIETAWEENAVWAFAEALYAHKGTEREQQIARAMVAGTARRATRRKSMIDPILKAALETAAASEDPKKALDELFKKLDEASPASEPGAVTQTQTAEDNADQGPPMARRAQVAAGQRPAPRGVTMPELMAMLAERDERARLMTANADRLTAEQSAFAGDLELPKLRRFVAMLAPRPAPSGTGGDAGGAVKPSAEDAAKKPTPGAGDELDERDRRLMRSIEQATDATTEQVERTRQALEKDEAGLLSLSRLKAMKATKATKTA